MPITTNGWLSLGLWLIMVLCLLYYWMVHTSFKWHSWKKGENIFGSKAGMESAKWKGRMALFLVVLIAAHGWRYLFYPFQQLFF